MKTLDNIVNSEKYFKPEQNISAGRAPLFPVRTIAIRAPPPLGRFFI